MRLSRRFWPVIAALNLAATPAAAELESLEVPVLATLAVATEAGSAIEQSLTVEPALELRLTPNAVLHLAARLRLDFDEAIEPGALDRSTYSSVSQPLQPGNSGSLELREAFVEWRLDNGVVRLGKQQLVWGRLDGIKVLDVVNPRDFREFIMADLDDSRIPLWSAYLDRNIGDWRAELAFAPDATGHALPANGAWFELRAPRFRYGAAADSPALPLTTRRPTIGFSDAGWGLRLTRRLGSVDLRAVAWSGMDPEPLGRRVTAAAEPGIERYYERRDLFGLNLDGAIGRLAYRAELSWLPDRHFNTRDSAGLDTTRLDQLRAAVGVDLQAPWDLFINTQLLIDRVSNAPASLLRPATDRIATLFLRRGFVNDRLNLELRWYRSLTDNDDLLGLRARWQFLNDAELRLAFDQFAGTRDGLFGQFRDRDRVTLTLARTF